MSPINGNGPSTPPPSGLSGKQEETYEQIEKVKYVHHFGPNELQLQVGFWTSVLGGNMTGNINPITAQHLIRVQAPQTAPQQRPAEEATPESESPEPSE